MDDIFVKVCPTTKLKLWKAVKKEVLLKMDKDIISPDRADEILGSIKPYIAKANSPEETKKLYESFPEMYEELHPVTHDFEMKEEEAIDKIFSLLLDEILDSGDFDGATALMDEMKACDDQKLFINELNERFPKQMQIILERVNRIE